MNGSGKIQQSSGTPSPTRWNWFLWALLAAAVVGFCAWRAGWLDSIADMVDTVPNPNMWV